MESMDWKLPKATALIERALVEDRATEDVTTLASIDPALMAEASILAKQSCVLAGFGLVERVFEVFAQLDPAVIGKPLVQLHDSLQDGSRLEAGQVVATIRHQARVVLSCERVILNLLQHLSGIATETRRYVDELAGTKAVLLDTRKTIPGLRRMEKYAVACGGGTNHRLDLADGILVKNNHIDLGGGVAAVCGKLLARRKGGLKLEVEVRNMDELEAALANGAEAILLDNMTPGQTRMAVARARQHPAYIPLESSGGITIGNIRQYAECGVDFISVGALTHSSPAVDLSMRIRPA
jgi:nicotinate-nucleotide pyrophosphorylase (carboxylating)